MWVDRIPHILNGHFFPSYDLSEEEEQSLLKWAEKKPKVVLGMTEEGARESIEREAGNSTRFSFGKIPANT